MSFKCPKNCPNRSVEPNCHNTCIDYLADKIMYDIDMHREKNKVNVEGYDAESRARTCRKNK